MPISNPRYQEKCPEYISGLFSFTLPLVQRNSSCLNSDMNKTKPGSALVIALIIALVVVSGALGYVYYQNMNKPAETATVTEESESDGVEQKTYTSEAIFPAQLSFSYPTTWKLDVDGTIPTSEDQLSDGQVYGQTATVTSPSGAYQVSFPIAYNSGIGGACDPDSSGKLEYVKQYGTSEFDDAIVMATMTKAYSWVNDTQTYAGYQYDIALWDKSAAGSQVGDSICDTYMMTLLRMYTPSDEAGADQKLMGAQLLINDLPTPDGEVVAYDSQDVILDKMQGEEFDQAIAILLSTKRVK